MLEIITAVRRRENKEEKIIIKLSIVQLKFSDCILEYLQQARRQFQKIFIAARFLLFDSLQLPHQHPPRGTSIRDGKTLILAVRHGKSSNSSTRYPLLCY